MRNRKGRARQIVRSIPPEAFVDQERHLKNMMRVLASDLESLANKPVELRSAADESRIEVLNANLARLDEELRTLRRKLG